MTNEQVNTDKYEGPSKLASSLGDAKLYIIGGSLVGGAGGAAVGALIKPESKLAQWTIEQAANFSKEDRNVAHLAQNRGSLVIAGVLIGSTVLGLVGGIWGLIKGWKNAGKGRLQFDTLKAQRDEALLRLEGLQSQVQGLQTDVATGQKRFTDMHTSRSEHGSHAAAHEAAVLQDASAEMAR